MIINVITLFPDAFTSFLEHSIPARAIAQKAVEIKFVDLRDFGMGNYNHVDDYPYGGGAGMVLRPEPLYNALESINFKEKKCPVVYFTPQAKLFRQTDANRYAQIDEIIIICGHYKGIDQRIRDAFVTEEFSIGDYVLSGGELPAMVFIDAVSRLQNEVLGDIESALTDSHQDGILGCPHYTRPADFMGMKVPEVLLGGNHKLIDKWREETAVNNTKKIRPDLLDEE